MKTNLDSRKLDPKLPLQESQSTYALLRKGHVHRPLFAPCESAVIVKVYRNMDWLTRAVAHPDRGRLVASPE